MQFIVYWVPTVVWMGLIFFFSSHERVEVSNIYAVQFLVFKTLHLIEYGILYILLYRSFRTTNQIPEWQNRYNAWLFAVMYAMTDEIHQVFIPTREGRIRDIVIDTIGISIAAYFVWKLLPRAPKELKNWAKKLQLI